MYLERLVENVKKSLIIMPAEHNGLDLTNTKPKDPKCLLSLLSLKTITFH